MTLRPDLSLIAGLATFGCNFGTAKEWLYQGFSAIESPLMKSALPVMFPQSAPTSHSRFNLFCAVLELHIKA